MNKNDRFIDVTTETIGKLFCFRSKFTHIFYSNEKLTERHYILSPNTIDAFFVLHDIKRSSHRAGYYLIVMIDKHGKLGHFVHGDPWTLLRSAMTEVK